MGFPVVFLRSRRVLEPNFGVASKRKPAVSLHSSGNHSNTCKGGSFTADLTSAQHPLTLGSDAYKGKETGCTRIPMKPSRTPSSPNLATGGLGRCSRSMGYTLNIRAPAPACGYPKGQGQMIEFPCLRDIPGLTFSHATLLHLPNITPQSFLVNWRIAESRAAACKISFTAIVVVI